MEALTVLLPTGVQKHLKPALFSPRTSVNAKTYLLVPQLYKL